MDLKIKDQTFIVCGATSGFGLAIANQLLTEGAKIIALARGEEKLRELQDGYTGQVDILIGDITDDKTIENLLRHTENKDIHGILVNAGGPPAMKFFETRMSDWDEAYKKVLRWKVKITRDFLKKFEKQKYGRFLYIESSAVKQPLENLVLSTSLRLAVAGFVKTLSQEMPDRGVTFNVLAPGYHQTPAVDRLITKKAEQSRISRMQAKKEIEATIPLNKTGDVRHLASLAVWLLSPLSEYVTGQVYAVDGGVIRSTL
ncbi:MAG: SDR family oxidoreductase [Bacteroidales bacterium]|nr:SDR family oxidoreductase [Bacteroidales bacterium]